MEPNLTISDKDLQTNAALAMDQAAKYGEKVTTTNGILGNVDIDFKDGQYHVIMEPGRGQFNKAETNIAYKGELKYGVAVDGPINPGTGGMIRKITINVVEETLEQQLARQEKSKGKYWMDFVRAFSKLPYDDMRKYCAGDVDGFRYAILNTKRDGMLFEWDKKVLAHREGPNTRRYYAFCELNPEYKEKVHAKFVAAYKKQQKVAAENIPSEALVASLVKTIGQLRAQLASGRLDEEAMMAVEAYVISKEAELAKLQAPVKPAKPKRASKKELGEAAKKLAAKKPLTVAEEKAKKLAEDAPKPFYEPENVDDGVEGDDEEFELGDAVEA